jgi:NAD-dependent deacetylase
MSVWGTESWESEESRKDTSGRDCLPEKFTRETVITVLSGAGISSESGIPTFRGSGGLWSQDNIAKVATPTGFAADPSRGWRFYDDRRQNMIESIPNPAHRILAELEKSGYDVKIITQNVDRLHQRAGSSNVIELHGTVWELRCSNDYCRTAPFENYDVPLKEIPPICDSCGSHLRPNVVFFEEELAIDNIKAADNRTKVTDLFLVVGTSGVVYPAAAYAQIARMCGAYVMEFNIEQTPLSPYCNESHLAPCGERLPEVIARLTNGAVTL